VNSAEGLKDEEPGILDKVLQASNQEEVIHENLRDRKTLKEAHFTVDTGTLLISVRVRGFLRVFRFHHYMIQ